MALIINQYQVTFQKDTRTNKFIILGFDVSLMSFIGQGGIMTMFIKMVQSHEDTLPSVKVLRRSSTTSFNDGI